MKLHSYFLAILLLNFANSNTNALNKLTPVEYSTTNVSLVDIKSFNFSSYYYNQLKYSDDYFTKLFNYKYSYDSNIKDLNLSLAKKEHNTCANDSLSHAKSFDKQENISTQEIAQEIASDKLISYADTNPLYNIAAKLDESTYKSPLAQSRANKPVYYPENYTGGIPQKHKAAYDSNFTKKLNG